MRGVIGVLTFCFELTKQKVEILRALPSVRDLSGLSYIEVAHIHPLRSQVCDKLSALSAKCDLRTRSK